jgi:sterol desaturase/sphingolipid hydroxylase (fatty acid hydroxylase superfamily)
MEINFIALAVPFFFIAIGIELWVARRRGREVYRFGDALIDLSTGVTQQVTLLGGNLVLLGAYIWLWKRYRVFHFENDSVAAWVIAFFAVDFLYYWWHRLTHEVNFMWASHVTHHSSEDYNLAVALRQSIFSSWTSWPFYSLLAFVGIPPLVWGTIQSFSTLYQFWIHTQLIDRTGPLDRVINTPSLHRVHHAINPRYLDKNYGGTLMIWDRLFGTYEPETEPCVYGLVKPLASYNPLWAQVHYLVELAQAARRTPRLADKVKLWFMSPETSIPGLPEKAPPPEVSPSTFVKYAPALLPGLRGYLLVNFTVVVATAFLLMLRPVPISPSVMLAAGGLVVLSLLTTGALLEGRHWALPLELLRLALVGVAPAVWLWGVLPVAEAAVAAAVVAMAVWLTRLPLALRGPAA